VLSVNDLYCMLSLPRTLGDDQWRGGGIQLFYLLVSIQFCCIFLVLFAYTYWRFCTFMLCIYNLFEFILDIGVYSARHWWGVCKQLSFPGSVSLCYTIFFWDCEDCYSYGEDENCSCSVQYVPQIHYHLWVNLVECLLLNVIRNWVVEEWMSTKSIYTI
jgi:hypothetical protein